jgi:hypothetical protein
LDPLGPGQCRVTSALVSPPGRGDRLARTSAAEFLTHETFDAIDFRVAFDGFNEFPINLIGHSPRIIGVGVAVNFDDGERHAIFNGNGAGRLLRRKPDLQFHAEAYWQFLPSSSIKKVFFLSMVLKQDTTAEDHQGRCKHNTRAYKPAHVR